MKISEVGKGLKNGVATGVNVIDVSPIATPDSLRFGPIDQGVGRSRLRRRGQRLAPHHRPFGTLSAARADDLILARRRSWLTGAQTTGLLAHLNTSFRFQATRWFRKSRPTAASFQSQATPASVKTPNWVGGRVSGSGNSLYSSRPCFNPLES